MTYLTWLSAQCDGKSVNKITQDLIIGVWNGLTPRQQRQRIQSWIEEMN